MTAIVCAFFKPDNSIKKNINRSQKRTPTNDVLNHLNNMHLNKLIVRHIYFSFTMRISDNLIKLF